MGRILTISILLASFLAIPALCMGGVITHACKCTSDPVCMCSSDCDHGSSKDNHGNSKGDHGDCEHEETNCGHEGECPDDPCSVSIIRAERRADSVITMSHPALAPAFILISVTQPSTHTVSYDVHHWSDGCNLPFPASDLPLLI